MKKNRIFLMENNNILSHSIFNYLWDFYQIFITFSFEKFPSFFVFVAFLNKVISKFQCICLFNIFYFYILVNISALLHLNNLKIIHYRTHFSLDLFIEKSQISFSTKIFFKVSYFSPQINFCLDFVTFDPVTVI